VVQELNSDPDFHLRKLVADMIERHFVKGLIAISGQWSCEYCVGRGRTRQGGIHWPYAESAGHALRTSEHHEDTTR
jgi:hypothetical protein